MRIAIFGIRLFNYTRSMCYALEKLGHEVLMIENSESDDKKLLEKKSKIKNFRPNLFINFCGNYVKNIIDSEFLKSLDMCKKISVYADSISFVGSVEQNFYLYDKVFVFELEDVEFLKNRYNIDALLSIASVAEEIHCKDYGEVEKIYDISFVGAMTEERMEFFDEIAKFAYCHGYKFVWYGHFWHDRHWWQRIFSKRKFAKKHPYLVNFVVNRYIEPQDAALLYQKTRICLNKHISRHKALNSRTFEIMGNGSFVLCDEREQAHDLGLVDGINIAFYKDVNDCKTKIKYYLDNSIQREQIALNGAELVRNKYTTKEVMKRMLEIILKK